MESHINFCALYSGRNDLGSEPVKIGIYQLASSITPKEHRSNVEPVIQEVSDEQSNEEIVNLDDELENESEEELENDPIAQELSNKFPYWSDREKEIKYIEIKKITSIRSYQQSPTCVRQVIMTELEINLIQEWRDQSGRFASCENEEIMKADNDKVTKQNEQIVLQQIMIQLNVMVE